MNMQLNDTLQLEQLSGLTALKAEADAALACMEEMDDSGDDGWGSDDGESLL
jgi:hypothetical protein